MTSITLDITESDLNLKYKPNGKSEVEYTVNGLATALRKLLTIEGSTPGKSVLAEEVVKQPVVDAITASSDFTNKVYIKAAPADEVYTKTAADTAFAKIDASNLTDAANKKAFAEAILPAKDGTKSILVEKLGGFLDENAKAYSNNTKTAKELLVPSAADLVQDHDFKRGIDKSIKEMAVSSNLDFKKNVREVMLQSYFEPPTSDDVALNWTW